MWRSIRCHWESFDSRGRHQGLQPERKSGHLHPVLFVADFSTSSVRRRVGDIGVSLSVGLGGSNDCGGMKNGLRDPNLIK